MAAARPAMHTGRIEVREVVRDETVIAVLMAIDNGDTFTVVAEVFGSGDNGADSINRRPYSFADADAGMAFFSEALTAFTYLGCEVRAQ
jgi:hypothetical protein